MGSLGNSDAAQRAISDAKKAIELLNTEPNPTAELIAGARLDLGAAHLVADDLDAAHSTLPFVLELPSERRTGPVIERAIKIGRSLVNLDSSSPRCRRAARAHLPLCRLPGDQGTHRLIDTIRPMAIQVRYADRLLHTQRRG
jgi:hypothetical protein